MQKLQLSKIVTDGWTESIPSPPPQPRVTKIPVLGV